MAKNTFLRDWVINGEKDISKIENYLRTIKNTNNTFTVFFISDITKRYYHPNGQKRFISENNSGDKWYFEDRNKTKEYDVIVSEDEMNDGVLSVFINHQVYDYENNFIGITGVGIALETIQKLINEYHKKNNLNVYIVNKNGKIIFQDSNSKNSIHNEPYLKDYANEILASKNRAINYKNDDGNLYLNSRYIEEFNWYLIVEENGDIVDKSTMKILKGNLLGAFVVTIIVLILSNIIIKGYQRRLEEMATTDHLTQALNRRAFDSLYKQTIKMTKRSKDQTFSIAIFDIDNFKNINDTYGHLIGDKVIYSIAQTIRKNIRESDIFCRWGGEEFLLVLTGCDIEAAMQIIENIRIQVCETPCNINETSLSITISAGIAKYSNDDNGEDIIRRADEALYRAKTTGKNKVEITRL